MFRRQFLPHCTSPDRFRLCVPTRAFTLFDTLNGGFAGGNIIGVVGFGLRALPSWRSATLLFAVLTLGSSGRGSQPLHSGPQTDPSPSLQLICLLFGSTEDIVQALGGVQGEEESKISFRLSRFSTMD